MSQKNETIPLLIALLATAAMLGGGYLWVKNRCAAGSSFFLCGTARTPASSPTSAGSSPLPPPPSPREVVGFPVPRAIASGTRIRVNGATSMVQMNTALQRVMEKKFAGVTVLTKADGSDRGIDEVLAGSADIAAVSRSLTPEEEANGLASVPIVRDSIAIVIGTSNPFSGSLSSQQVKDIFTGQIMKWSEVGGAPTEIRVINRPPVSGTYKTFQQEVLQDAPFGTGSNFTTLARDATTPMLQALKLNGIGYATYTQVAGQRTVRALAIDGISPSDPNYPFQRTLYYVYKEPASGAARAFLGFATSADGQEAIARSNEDLQK